MRLESGFILVQGNNRETALALLHSLYLCKVAVKMLEDSMGEPFTRPVTFLEFSAQPVKILVPVAKAGGERRHRSLVWYL